MSARMMERVPNIEVADIETTINNIPGYSPSKGRCKHRASFTLLIGILVIGGFFQIQILQKVPQIGVLKAIGSSNAVVGLSAVIQIIVVTAHGCGDRRRDDISVLTRLSLPPSRSFSTATRSSPSCGFC
jgi:predicted lysophospholipase L1 biosynthesis ABC-type transport system permease subunit